MEMNICPHPNPSPQHLAQSPTILANIHLFPTIPSDIFVCTVWHLCCW